MYERNWILGDDLRPEDNLMDGITFDEIIMRELLMRNIDIIMAEAKKGRGDYENS